MKPIDAGALIDSGPWSTYQKLLTFLAALAIIIDGFDIQILAFAIPSLMKEWHAARSAFAPVLALGLAGMAIGGPIAGYVGDHFGRRFALIGCVTFFGMATAATAFVDSVAALAVLRFLTGMGAGGAVPNAGALTAEFAPARRRAVAVKLTIVCIPLGGMLGGMIAAKVLPLYGWRTLYLIGGVTPLLLALVLLLLLPESPRFLAQHPAGWSKLANFLRRLGHSIPADSSFVENGSGSGQPAGRATVSELFSPDFLRDTTGLWIAFFCCLSSIYLVFGWLPTLLSTMGLDVAAASSGLAIYNFGGVLGVLIWAMLTTMMGSRMPLISGAFGAALSALAILLVPIETGQRPLLLAALGLHGLLIQAVQTSMYALATHVYPTRVRASGVACAATAGRAGGILSSLFGSVIIGGGAGVYWGAISIALIGVCCGLAIVRRHIPAPEKIRRELS